MVPISIITVCYNASSVILPTLRSVAEQCYRGIEYIVVDGASQDDTIELVKIHCPFAKVLSEPDKGIYEAMNKGIKLATGEYIWFLNAGDTFRTPKTVQNVAECITSQVASPDVVYGDTMIVNRNYQDLHLRRLRPPKGLVAKDFLKGMLVCHQAFIARRAVVPQYDLSYKLSADYDWCLRVLQRSKCNCQMEQVLVNYLEGGLSEKKHFKSLLERFHIMRKHFGLSPTIFAHLSFLFRPHR